MGEKEEKSKVEKLYDILQNDQHYKDVLPDKQTFVDKLQNIEFSAKFHDILMNDNRYKEVVPSFDNFYKSMQIPVATMESKPMKEMPEIYRGPGVVRSENIDPADLPAENNQASNATETPRQPSAAEISVQGKTPIENDATSTINPDEDPEAKQKRIGMETDAIIAQYKEKYPEIFKKATKKEIKQAGKQTDAIIAQYKEKYPEIFKNATEEEIKQATPEINELIGKASKKPSVALPSAALPSAAELSLETVLRKTAVDKMTPRTGELLLKEPVEERSARKMAKEYFTSPQVKERLAASGAITEEEKKVTIPEGGVAVAMLTSKYPKGYDPTKYLPKSDAFSLDNIMALTDGMDYYIEADKKIRNTSYNKFFGPVAESEQNAEKRGEARTVKGLNDQEFIEMIDKYNKDPKIESWRKLTDDEKAALIIDRRKRQAAGYFDFKNNLNSNILNEDLEQCTGDKVCRSNTSFNALNQLKQFRKHNKQTIINAYKDLNPGKEFTKEMEAEVDDYLKLLEEEKNSNLHSK